jgi:hypothetical protein
MLYVKVDAAGNPVEVAKSYRKIKEEFLAKGSIIQNEIIFSGKLEDMGYAPVPFAESISPKAGMKIVPDVPQKEADGTMKRKWKYEKAEDKEIAEVSSIMRERRSQLLKGYVDNISPVRWEKFSAEEKTEISNWHQSLLDISNQEGWPYVSFQPVPEVLK